MRPTRSAAAALVVLGIFCAPSGSAATRGTSASVVGTFVGSAGATGSFVAVVAAPAKQGKAKRGVVVYVCDGNGVSAWFRFPSLVTGNTVDLSSKTGAKLHVTLTSLGAVGTVDLPGARAVRFKAAPAKGVAGLYLVNRAIGRVKGVSADGRARLVATVSRQAAGRYSIAGTVTAHGQTRTLKGSGTLSGSLTKFGSWIVMPNGRVKGSAGGGNCSAWASIKEAMFGVHCGFFMTK